MTVQLVSAIVYSGAGHREFNLPAFEQCHLIAARLTLANQPDT
jgi:hypothetical protein